MAFTQADGDSRAQLIRDLAYGSDRGRSRISKASSTGSDHQSVRDLGK